MGTPQPWNANNPYFPGNIVVYAVTNWLATAVNRGKRPDLFPDIWSNQGGSGGGGGGGVTAVSVQGPGLLNVGTASNVILRNTGAVNITSGNPATLSVSGPDASYNFTLTNLAPAPFVAGYGIGISGDVISNTGVASLVGGTNATVTGPTAGNVYTINNTATGTLTPGTGISIVGTTISNTGVVSLSNTNNSIFVSGSPGGTWSVAPGLNQTSKWYQGVVIANNTINSSGYQTIANITVGGSPAVPIAFWGEYAGVIVSVSLQIANTVSSGYNFRIYDYVNSACVVSTFAPNNVSNYTQAFQLNFLLKWGTHYSNSTTTMFLEGYPTASSTMLVNGDGSNTFMVMGIN